MTSQPPDGWYPDQGDPSLERWFYRGRWTDMTRPVSPDAGASVAGQAPTVERRKPPNWPLIAALLLSIAGLLIAGLTSVSLLTGMNQVYLGAAIDIAGAVIAWAGRLSVAARVTCTILALLAVVVAVDDQRQLNDKRDQLQHILNTP